MAGTPPKAVVSWARQFGNAPLPVLARTVAELEKLAADEESVTPQCISEVVLHDPLMTLKVLHYLQQHRRARQTADITTIPHALMMLGLTPFFNHFRAQPTLQDKLAAHPLALEEALHVVSRARHAALYARDWGTLRHDIEIDELAIAALLHDLAELLLWCMAPKRALLIRRLQRRGRIVRSETAQHAVLGFSLLDLQFALWEEWRLPRLLRQLMNDRHLTMPRARNVALATKLARHLAHSWDDPALPDDFAAIGKFLGMSSREARSRVVRVALAAARDRDWYGVPPAAALLPLVSQL